jgi:hypothetical protein
LLIQWQGTTRWRALAIGAVLGLLVAIEILPVVSFVPLTLIYLLSRRDREMRAWLLCALGVAIPLTAHAVLNVPITGDVIPAGFHTELFEFDGSGFDQSSLTGTLKHGSFGAAIGYASQSLFTVKGFFVFAPLCLAGLIAGILGWRWWWARARGVYVVLIGGTAISLGVALAMTNNLGGSAVGFRHAAYLSPAFAVLVLPWLADPSPARRRLAIVVTVAAVSAVVLLIFAVREPWFGLTLSAAPVGSWDQYVPFIARLVHGDLVIP